MLVQLSNQIDNGAYAPNPVTIVNGNQSAVVGSHLHRNGMLAAGGSLQLRQNNSNLVLGQLTLAHMAAFDDLLVSYAQAPTTYRNIKHNQEWQGIYNFAMRPISYSDKVGGLHQVVEATIPCRQCGIVLPFKLVSIDHSHAQAGSELAPIFKFFRALGLTNQSPSGQKGQQFSNMAASVGGSFAGDNSSSLNPVGVIIFSMFRNSGYWTNLKALTMHNFINLRPVCSFCNPSLGNH
jgi:hypothetical protein